MSRLISIFVIKHSQAIALLHITKTTVLLAKPTIGAYMDCAIASINVTCLVKPNIISTFRGPLSLRGPSDRRVRRAVATPLSAACVILLVLGVWESRWKMT